MEILKELPNEIKSKIFKYQSHPVAEILKDKIEEYNKYFDERVRRCKSLWNWKDGDEYIVLLDHNFYDFWQEYYATKYNEWEQEAPTPTSTRVSFESLNYDSD